MNINTEVLKHKIYTLLLVKLILVCCIEQSFGQGISGARGSALAQAVTAMPDDKWSVFQNPAMLPGSGNHISFFAIRYYGLNELTDSAVAGVVNADYGTIGIGLHTYGFDLYRESQFRLAYMKAFNNFRLGGTLRYQHVSIERYGSAGVPAFDVGFSFKITDGLWMGGRISNITNSRLGEVREDLPSELVIGFSYQLSERVLLLSDFYKDVQFPISYRAGLEFYVFEDILQLRGGISTEPVTFTLGLGLHRGFWSASLAAQHHEWLGWSPGIGLDANW